MDIDFAEELSIWGAQAEGDADDASPISNAIPMVIPHDFWVMLCKTKLAAAGLLLVASAPPANNMLSSWLTMLAGRFRCLGYRCCCLQNDLDVPMQVRHQSIVKWLQPRADAVSVLRLRASGDQPVTTSYEGNEALPGAIPCLHDFGR